MKILFLGLMLFLAGGAWANAEVDIAELKTAFRSISEIEISQSIVPTVVEAPISFENNMLNNVMVIEKESQKTQPVIVLSKDVVQKNILTAKDSFDSKNASYLTDGRLDNFKEYPISESGDRQSASIILSSSTPVATSSLTFYLDGFVSLPETVEIRVIIDGEEKIILGRKEVIGTTVNFPKITAQEFVINLEYVQPLRIRELTLNQENLNISRESSVRFLAQPNKKYEIYFNADRYVNPYNGEMPDLNSNKDIISAKKISAKENILYKKSDIDEDGIADETDNCVKIANPDQVDINNNGQGDACDDFDKDGVINQIDNCRDLTNRDQGDKDLDGIGDVCDEKENRVLQNQKWLPLALIILVAGVVGLLFAKVAKAK